MNILVLNWRDPKNPLSGGAEYVTMQHAKAWVKKGNTVTWFTSNFANAKTQEVVDGIKIIRKGSSLTVHLLAAFYYLFSGEKFDVVVDEIHGIPFFTPLYVRKPKIAFIHEVAGEIWDYMYPFPISKVGKFFEKIYFLLYKNVPFWTDAPSTVVDLKKEGISEKHCTVIYCPISNKVVKELPLKEKNPTFIFVSRLVKMKGIERVIDAFALIVQQNPRSQLWIVGGGDPVYIKILKSKIQNIEKSSNIQYLASNITFFGRVSEVKKLQLMKKAHILLHASVKEGWGLVVLEAASQGTPSVVYNVAGLRDSVKNNKTGIVLKENVPMEMAKQAKILLENKTLYQSFQKYGCEWAHSLQWKDVTEMSEKLLAKTIKK